MVKVSPKLLRPHDGVAYGILKCSDPRPLHAVVDRFKEAMENIVKAHEETKVPAELEFYVSDIVSGMAHWGLQEDIAGIVPHAARLERQGANIFIRSSLQGRHNLTSADELGNVINILYCATELFDAQLDKRDSVVMDIFFCERGFFLSKFRFDLLREGRVAEAEKA